MTENYIDMYTSDELRDDCEDMISFTKPNFDCLDYARERLRAFGDFLSENAERILDSETSITYELTTEFCDSDYDSFSEWRSQRRAM